MEVEPGTELPPPKVYLPTDDVKNTGSLTPGSKDVKSGSSGSSSKSSWVWPTKNTKLSGYHYTSSHHAIDIGLRTGDPVASPTAGEVVYAGWDTSGYGNLVIIKTAKEGYRAFLAHLSEIKVKVGQTVKAGQVIGLGGSTGNSTGPHLHFEIRTAGGGGWINPYDIFGNNPSAGNPVDYSPGSGTDYSPGTSTGDSSGDSSSDPGTPLVDVKIPIPGGKDLAITIPGPKQIFGELFANVNWGSVAAVGIGILIIGIALYGLVTQEGFKIVGKTLNSGLKEALGK